MSDACCCPRSPVHKAIRRLLMKGLCPAARAAHHCAPHGNALPRGPDPRHTSDDSDVGEFGPALHLVDHLLMRSHAAPAQMKPAHDPNATSNGPQIRASGVALALWASQMETHPDPASLVKPLLEGGGGGGLSWRAKPQALGRGSASRRRLRILRAMLPNAPKAAWPRPLAWCFAALVLLLGKPKAGRRGWPVRVLTPDGVQDLLRSREEGGGAEVGGYPNTRTSNRSQGSADQFGHTQVTV